MHVRAISIMALQVLDEVLVQQECPPDRDHIVSVNSKTAQSISDELQLGMESGAVAPFSNIRSLAVDSSNCKKTLKVCQFREPKRARESHQRRWPNGTLSTLRRLMRWTLSAFEGGTTAWRFGASFCLQSMHLA